jgi:hypothetical protein
MKLYKISRSSDSAFPYNIWSEKENSFVAKAYTKEMAKLLLHALKSYSNAGISIESIEAKDAE